MPRCGATPPTRVSSLRHGRRLWRRCRSASAVGKETPALGPGTRDVRAQLTEAESSNIRKYKLGKTVLYERATIVDRGSGLLGFASRIAFKMMNLSICVDDLVGGKRIECKDILEMLAVQEQLK